MELLLASAGVAFVLSVAVRAARVVAADRQKLVASYGNFARARGFRVVSEAGQHGAGWPTGSSRPRFDVRLEGVVDDVGLVLESRVFSGGARTHVIASAIQPISTTVHAMARLAPDGLTRCEPFEVHLGDASFDHAFVVEAPGRADACRVLRPEIRAVLQSFAPSVDLSYENGRVDFSWDDDAFDLRRVDLAVGVVLDCCRYEAVRDVYR